LLSLSIFVFGGSGDADGASVAKESCFCGEEETAICCGGEKRGLLWAWTSVSVPFFALFDLLDRRPLMLLSSFSCRLGAVLLSPLDAISISIENLEVGETGPCLFCGGKRRGTGTGISCFGLWLISGSFWSGFALLGAGAVLDGRGVVVLGPVSTFRCATVGLIVAFDLEACNFVEGGDGDGRGSTSRGEDALLVRASSCVELENSVSVMNA